MVSGAPWEAHWPSKLNLSGYLKVQGPSIHFHSTRPQGPGKDSHPTGKSRVFVGPSNPWAKQRRMRKPIALGDLIWTAIVSNVGDQTVQCSSAFEEREGRVSVHVSGSTTLSQIRLQGKSKIKIEASRPSPNRRFDLIKLFNTNFDTFHAEFHRVSRFSFSLVAALRFPWDRPLIHMM